MRPSQYRSIFLVCILAAALLIAVHLGLAQAHSVDTWPAADPAPQTVITEAVPVVPDAPQPQPPDLSMAALDAPPDKAEAVVADADNPNWVTRYGTQLGKMLLPPRHPDQSFAPGGAVPVLSGFWFTTTIQSGAQGVTAIAYAPDGRIFAALWGAGLGIYVPDATGVYQWITITQSAGGLLNNYVTALAILNNQLWIGTNGSGVNAYDLTTGVWISYTTANSSLPDNFINRLTPVSDPNGPDYIWISTDTGGAAKYTPGRLGTWNIINTVDGLPNNLVYDVAVDLNGAATTTWLATASGLVSSTNLTAFQVATGGGACVGWDYASRLIIDQQHSLWLTPIQLIPGLSPTGDQPSAAVPNPIGVCVRTITATWALYNGSAPGLPSNQVTDLSEDFAGRIWMATSGGGAVNDHGTWRFYTAPSSPLITNSLSSVLAVGEDVWWGQWRLNAFSVHSPNWLRYNAAQIGGMPTALYLEMTRTWAGANTALAFTDGANWLTKTLPGNASVVSSIARDGGGNLWAGTYGSGVYELNSNNVVTDHFTTTHGLPGNIITALHTDDQGRLWVGTTNGVAMRAEAGYWLTFTTSTAPLASNAVSAIAQDNTQRMWVGTNKGISIYDLGGVGSLAWTTQTQATGMPSTTVNAITRDPYGTMWVATNAGVGAWNPISATWTIYSTTNGALPNNRAIALASDPAGHIWVSTYGGGLAVLEGSTWRHLHMPQTAIENDRVLQLAADGERAWFAGSNTIAVRGILTSPIGVYAPIIASFVPTAASPGDKIVITGDYFNASAVAYLFNEVVFPYQPANKTAFVVSATKTLLTVKVPDWASSGQLQVVANGLHSQLSAASFQLKPKVTGAISQCLGLGSELKINGVGFLDGNAAAYVTVGNGPERVADATDPKQIRYFIRPGDTSGPVQVRLLNGQTAYAPNNVKVGSLQVVTTAVQQGIEGEQLIWGKRTAVLIQLQSVGDCAGGEVDEARLTWKLSTGPMNEYSGGGLALYPAGKTFGAASGASPAAFTVDNSVAINAYLHLDRLAQSLGLPASPYQSALQYFEGATITLKNNFVPVITLTLPAGDFDFIDTTPAQRSVMMFGITGEDPAHRSSAATFLNIMVANMRAMARIYPQQDGDAAIYGQYSWLDGFANGLRMPPVSFASGGNYQDAIEEVNDRLEPSGKAWAVALIDAANLAADSNYVGRGGIGEHTVAAANLQNSGGEIILHEVLHGMGFINANAANYLPNQSGGEDNHSKYNEGKWADDIGSSLTYTDAFQFYCGYHKTFAQALEDQTGANKRVLWLGGATPEERVTTACDMNLLNNQWGTAKSLMSYAPYRNNYNSFMEPVDYRSAIAQICSPASTCPGYKGTPLSTLIGLARPSAAAAPTRTLRLSGRIDVSDTVTTSLSYVAINDGEVTPPEPKGGYHLIVRDSGNAILHDQVFDLQFEEPSPHVPNPSPVTKTVAFFNLRVPFPVNALKAELRHNGNVIWSRTVSANAPTVNFVTPNGGTYNAANVVTVTWTANDVDGDTLQFGLDYSPDNGTTWTTIDPKILGTSYLWTPSFVPASTTARLRLRASDGFNVGIATSNPFTLTPRAPVAIIRSPGQDDVYTEGSILTLDGGSVTGDGPNLGTFIWQRDGVTLGTTRTITTALNAIGVLTYSLSVAKDSLHGTSVVSITVVPDYDHDTLPNNWESQYQLNPMNAADALNNPDNDGLTNLDEYHYGTNPKVADTDGDGYSDGAEIAAGTDPLRADRHPIATPILNVGSVSMGFVADEQTPQPEPKSTWVTNGGGGSLNWSVTQGANWLTVSPSSGSAPQELTVKANPSSLVTGTYVSHITVTAASVITGSPHVITVTLHVDAVVPSYSIYLPLVMR